MKKLVIALVCALILATVPMVVRAADPIDDPPAPEDYPFVRLEGMPPVSNKASITSLMVKVIVENEYGYPEVDDFISQGINLGFKAHFWQSGEERNSTEWADEIVINTTGIFYVYIPVERVPGSFGDYVSKSGWKFDFVWYAQHICTGGETCDGGKATIWGWKDEDNGWYHFDGTAPGKPAKPLDAYKSSKIFTPDKKFRIQYRNSGVKLSDIKINVMGKGVTKDYFVTFEFYACDAMSISTDDLGATYTISKDGKAIVGFKDQADDPSYGFDDFMKQAATCKSYVRMVIKDDQDVVELRTKWQLIK